MGVTDIFKGLITAILVLMLMVVVPLFIMSNSIKATFLQPSFYSQLDSNVYIGIQSALIDTASSAIPQNELSTLGVTSGEVQQAFANHFTVEWVKDEISTASEDLIGYVTGQTQTFNFTISIKPEMTSVLNDIFTNSSMPSTEVPQMASSLASAVPDQIGVSSFPGAINYVNDLKSYVTLFLTISTVILVAIIVLLVLIFLLNMDLSKFASIIGWPMLIVGVVMVVAANALPGFISSSLPSSLNSMGNGIQVSPADVQIVVSVFRPMFTNISIQSIILVIVSVLLIAFSFIYPMVRKKRIKK